MSDDRLPKAVSESTMELLGLQVRVSVLDDGRRVIHAEDFDALLEALTGAPVIDVTPTPKE